MLKSGSTGPPGGPGPWRCVSASRGGTTHHGCGCMRAWECAGGGRESGSLSCWSMLEVSAGGRAADRGRGVLQCGLEVRAGEGGLLAGRQGEKCAAVWPGGESSR